MNETAVSIRGFVKRYGSFVVVNSIDLEVRHGEVFGLLGANGAGKTTTFECLEGLRSVNSGELRIAGCNPQTERRALRKKLGVQLQSSSLPDNIRVSEAIDLVCSWHGLPVPDELIEKFEMKELLKKQYHQLSTGQKRRVHLVLALCNRPEVLVLDEPTAGLDVQSRAQLHDEIRAIRTQFMGEKDGYLEWECCSAADAVIEILGHVRDAGDTVEDLRVERPSLEERFLEVVKEGKLK